jgi:mRNA export factor
MIVGAGADNTARLLDLSANGSSAHQVAVHEAPIRSIRFFELPSTREQLAVTGSWDKTVKYWDLRSPTLAGSVPIHEKVYSLDTKDNMLVIATAERKLHVVDLRNPTKIFKSPDCPLRHQIRVVTCFPDGQGFGVGGIEGRIGMSWNGDSDTKYGLY